MSKGFFRTIARFTMSRPKGLAPLVLPAEGGKEQTKEVEVPIFINVKALTFPLLVGLVKGAWAAAASLPVTWASSVYVPLIMCLVLGLLIAISNLLDQKLRVVNWIVGIAIGFLNSLVVFGAVMGISKA